MAQRKTRSTKSRTATVKRTTRTPAASRSPASRGAPSPDPFDWSAFERELLQGGTRRGGRRAGAGSREAAVADSLDEAERESLRTAAVRAQLLRSRDQPLGNVVFLHGITGADLAVVDATGDSDNVWVHPLRLIGGRIADLALDPSATKEANAALTVRATGVNKRFYGKAVLTLRGRWNVEPYAYDWRRDIDAASDGLAALVSARFPKQPVHLVAHSMGGLVARNFIRRHPRLWEEMQDPSLVAGGRLVMLGTPNYGSFAIPPVLTGDDQMMELLARLDIKHSQDELLTITNTFLGSYMLLPSPSRLSPSLQSLYQRETWGRTPGVSQAHLSRTFQFYRDLEGTQTIDPRRMIYVAGARRVTITGMSIVAPGEFDYRTGTDGDGRVPHALGLLDGVPAYYVDEVHGDLARNEQVLAAADELLQSGKTGELTTEPLRAPPTRAEPTMRQYRSAADLRLMEELARLADQAEAVQARTRGASDAELAAALEAELPVEQQRLAEDALISVALGSGRRSLPATLPPAAPVSLARSMRQTPPVALKVRVRWGDITQVAAPVVVVGHYQGIQPVNAIGAIDHALFGWIARAMKNRMISGVLGETFYVPTAGRIKANAAVVAGMGEFGRFSAEDLRLLMRNVALGAGALGLDSIATVVIGSGGHTLPPDVALAELLEGVGKGLRELRDEKVVEQLSVTTIDIVEHDARRAEHWAKQLGRMAESQSLANVTLELARPVLHKEAAARARRRTRADGPSADAAPARFDEIRMTVERPAVAPEVAGTRPGKAGTAGALTMLRYSAITKSAVVPVREVTVQSAFAEDAAGELRKASTRAEQQKFGRLLYTYLLPEEFQDVIDSDDALRLVVDRSTASFPWEMACFTGRGDGEPRWFGTDLRLSRQFRTTLSRVPGIVPPLNDQLRVLVIADPAPEKELQLPGARAEGRRVVDLLTRHHGDVSIDVQHRIGAAECDPTEVLALLLSGEFDIVHFAGHGNFDADDPDSTGWIFGRDKALTARDIFRARQVPRLVFANACFSGAVRPGPAFSADEMAPALATIAQAFFERGVPNYIGTGWPVGDRQALMLAEEFYARLLAGERISDALFEGRKRVFAQQIESTWGAYQHYGDPNDQLVRPRTNGQRRARPL